MLYLIESAGYKVGENNSISYFKLLKIGYSEENTKDKRYYTYKSHNPTCQVLYEIPECTEDDEKNVQYKFKEFLYEGFGREWFRYDESIVEFFRDTTIDEIRKLPTSPSLVNFKKHEAIELRKLCKEVLYTIFSIKRDIENIPYDVFLKDEILNFVEESITIGKVTNKEELLDYIKIKIGDSIVEKYNEIMSFKSDVIDNFFKEYNKINLMDDKLKYLCEYKGLTEKELEIILYRIGERSNIRSYYLALGPKKLKSISYCKTYADDKIGIMLFLQELLLDTIYSEFKVGDKLSLSWIKVKLADLYSSINYKSTPKASDLENFFVIKKCKITLEDKKKN